MLFRLHNKSSHIYVNGSSAIERRSVLLSPPNTEQVAHRCTCGVHAPSPMVTLKVCSRLTKFSSSPIFPLILFCIREQIFGANGSVTHLRPIHIERKWKRKRKCSLMFEIFSVIFLAFVFAYTRYEMAPSLKFYCLIKNNIGNKYRAKFRYV